MSTVDWQVAPGASAFVLIGLDLSARAKVFIWEFRQKPNRTAMPLSVSTVGFGVQTQLIGQESQVCVLIFFYIPRRAENFPIKNDATFRGRLAFRGGADRTGFFESKFGSLCQCELRRHRICTHKRECRG